jgi:hypothetical protein
MILSNFERELERIIQSIDDAAQFLQREAATYKMKDLFRLFVVVIISVNANILLNLSPWSKYLWDLFDTLPGHSIPCR